VVNPRVAADVVTVSGVGRNDVSAEVRGAWYTQLDPVVATPEPGVAAAATVDPVARGDVSHRMCGLADAHPSSN
jgi:hypothetical protein